MQQPRNWIIMMLPWRGVYSHDFCTFLKDQRKCNLSDTLVARGCRKSCHRILLNVPRSGAIRHLYSIFVPPFLHLLHLTVRIDFEYHWLVQAASHAPATTLPILKLEWEKKTRRLNGMIIPERVVCHAPALLRIHDSWGPYLWKVGSWNMALHIVACCHQCVPSNWRSIVFLPVLTSLPTTAISLICLITTHQWVL